MGCHSTRHTGGDGRRGRDRPRAAAHPGLFAAYLFGSVARGTAKASSDVDIAVLYAERPPFILGSPPMKLEGALERANAPPAVGLSTPKGG
jgi:predicted nucleotidyltransferase